MVFLAVSFFVDLSFLCVDGPVNFYGLWFLICSYPGEEVDGSGVGTTFPGTVSVRRAVVVVGPAVAVSIRGRVRLNDSDRAEVNVHSVSAVREGKTRAPR